MVVGRAHKVTDCLLHACIRVDIVLRQEVIKAVHQIGHASLVGVCDEMEGIEIFIMPKKFSSSFPLTSVVAAAASMT
jgi:hypothetical protein